MSSKNERPASQPRVLAVHCPRLDCQLTVEEHARCLYCHGDIDDVRSGKREIFCNYDPEKDPVSFGFPRASQRQLRG